MKIHTGTYFEVDVRGDSEALSAYSLETASSKLKARPSVAVHRACNYKSRRTGFLTDFDINYDDFGQVSSALWSKTSSKSFTTPKRLICDYPGFIIRVGIGLIRQALRKRRVKVLLKGQ